ncbi:MTH1187 family thiamine-binding protein [Thermogymnomonas acidicola]|uniref:MTH1187 family thiamine-binding protein n=1 Tax=Thermogymnomonas acidicola TaxID=399579 RepID=UPI0009467042|nr:MTH1187 family thiamine-binding protein [Thermogymnomonas acidicola]
MIVADVAFYPIGKGVSASEAIKKAIEALRGGAGVRCYPNSMATVMEAESLEQIFAAVARAEKALVDMGYPRVETILRVDDRRDLENSVERKLRALGEE